MPSAALLFLVVALTCGCQTAGTVGSDATEERFDPAAVTIEQKREVLEDIRSIIRRLNAIIGDKDFETWKNYCTDEYIGYWSSSEALAWSSNSPVMKRSGIVLGTLEDFFLLVVYPSRQNVKVDDIEFISYNRIKVIMFGEHGEEWIVYDLEKVGDTWKIGYWGDK